MDHVGISVELLQELWSTGFRGLCAEYGRDPAGNYVLQAFLRRLTSVLRNAPSDSDKSALYLAVVEMVGGTFYFVTA